MDRQGQITTVLGIGLLYTIVTSIFSLLQIISSAIVFQGTANKFIRLNIVWGILVVTIIIALNFWIKRLNQSIGAIIANKPIVGLTTGVVVLLESIYSLASSLPKNILSVISAIETTQYIDDTERIVSQAVIANSFSIVIILCQIILGIILIKVYKNRMN